METAVLGYIASVAIGLLLGLIGGGGSILTVPVLVYLFGVEPITAAGFSYFIVGATSCLGAVQYVRRGVVHLPSLWQFGLPSILAVFVVRRWVVPAIPEYPFGGTFESMTKDAAMMILFALLMFPAAWRMIRPMATEVDTSAPPRPVFLMTMGFLVGALTALVGVGGGFLIVPALLLMARLSMKEAVGTSLIIIALNAWVGFAGSIATIVPDWPLILSITALALLGVWLGTYLSQRIDGAKLKPAFGWFILIMGIVLLTMQ